MGVGLFKSQARRNRRAIAAWSDRAEDHRGAGAADDVRPGVRAGYRAHHGGGHHGQQERGGKLRLLHHG